MPAGAQLPAPEEFAGHWEGALQIPGAELTILVDLTREGDQWSGTIDIPMQGAKGMKLSDIRVEPPAVHFAIAGVPGDPIFDGTLADSRITGTLRQSGNQVPFYLGREKVAGPERPQEPKPPFPYVSEEVTYRNGEITLAGTLAIPAGKGPFPAALLLSGSGSQDRDETVFGHKPFLVLSDALARAGIAVLRVDDRGVGGSSGSTRDASTSDFAGDALAGIRFLRERKEVDRKGVGIIGHSEGAVVGPLAASRSKDVRFLVLLAGTGQTGADVVIGQMEEMSRRRGLPPEAIAAQNELMRIAVERAGAGADSAAIREAIEANGLRLRAAAPDSIRETIDLVRSGVESLTPDLESTWFRYFLGYDPRPALRKTRIPVLALNGELDVQVLADRNLPEIEKALGEAGNQDVTARRLPKRNHLFQPAGSGLPEEYMTIPTTIDPTVLELIRDWILQRFGPR